MKTLVRVAVIALTVTGFAASSHSASGNTEVLLTSKVSAMPVPKCPLNNPGPCHIFDVRDGQ
jgi:hypothetical protein